MHFITFCYVVYESVSDNLLHITWNRTKLVLKISYILMPSGLSSEKNLWHSLWLYCYYFNMQNLRISIQNSQNNVLYHVQCILYYLSIYFIFIHIINCNLLSIPSSITLSIRFWAKEGIYLLTLNCLGFLKFRTLNCFTLDVLLYISNKNII